MFKRIMTGVVTIPLLIGMLIANVWIPIIINIFMSAVSAVGVYEFLHAVKLEKRWAVSIPSILLGVAMPLVVLINSVQLAFYIYTTVMLCMMIFFHKNVTFKDFAYAYSMTLVISYAMSCVANMSLSNSVHAVFYFCFVIALPWLADAGGYFVGSALGKHKLCPEISPKKTVEGAVGGIIIGTGLTCLMALFFEKCLFTDGTQFDYITLSIISLVGSIISIFGDLSFSLIKRHCGIKDFGNILPGHGGVLDRFDSVVMVAPFVYTVIQYISILKV